MNPKDKTETAKKCGVVYKISCPECDHSYVGETARTMGQRLKEHLKTQGTITSAIGEHISQTGHPISIENVKIIGTESDWHRRRIKEAIEIKSHRPTLNRDGGYELAHIYNNFWSRENSNYRETNEISEVRTVE